jgi:iron complex transport system ATP-binding protein
MVALRGGQIIAQGAPDDVMTPDTILQVFGLTAEVVTDPVSGTPMCIPVGRRGAARKSHPAPSAAALNGSHEPVGAG